MSRPATLARLARSSGQNEFGEAPHEGAAGGATRAQRRHQGAAGATRTPLHQGAAPPGRSGRGGATPAQPLKIGMP